MPLEPPDPSTLESCGWICRTWDVPRANDQLENIDPFNRAAPEVLAVRIAVYQGLKKWELMREVSKRLADFQADHVQWTISYAFATRRAESINAAKQILLNAEARFPKAAIIKYNLACYCCQLGEIDNAKSYLQKAFEIDSTWRSQALDDEDLKPLWDSL